VRATEDAYLGVELVAIAADRDEEDVHRRVVSAESAEEPA
jgi:hypothetical protein